MNYGINNANIGLDFFNIDSPGITELPALLKQSSCIEYSTVSTFSFSSSMNMPPSEDNDIFSQAKLSGEPTLEDRLDAWLNAKGILPGDPAMKEDEFKRNKQELIWKNAFESRARNVSISTTSSKAKTPSTANKRRLTLNISMFSSAIFSREDVNDSDKLTTNQ